MADQATPAVGEELHQVQETTRASLEEIRRIARRLRPGVLEELGLASALKALTAEFSAPGLAVHHCIEANLPSLGEAAELVIYRIAQEGLTNAARHADACHVDLTLRRTPTGVELNIRDDGRGISAAPEGAGICGMRERALLIGADLAIITEPGSGTEIRLSIPIRHRSC